MGEHAAYGCDGLSFLVGKELCLELFSFYLQFGEVWDSGGDEVCGVGGASVVPQNPRTSPHPAHLISVTYHPPIQTFPFTIFFPSDILRTE